MGAVSDGIGRVDDALHVDDAHRVEPHSDGAAQTSAASEAAEQRRSIRIHYYVKILVSTFLCALLLIIGVPVFMESRVTGSLAYTALGVVLVGFGLVLAASVVVLLFHPPFGKVALINESNSTK